MADSDPQINISRIKVAGVGGLGLVVVVAAMAWQMPEVRGFVIAGIAGGIIGAAALLSYRRWRGPDTIGPGPIFGLDGRPTKSRDVAPARTKPLDRIVRSATVAGS